MSKRLDEAVQVLADAQGRPERIARGWRWLQVQQVVDEWEEASRWWQGEETIRVYRVLIRKGTVWELHRRGRGDWRLYRIYD